MSKFKKGDPVRVYTRSSDFPVWIDYMNKYLGGTFGVKHHHFSCGVYCYYLDRADTWSFSEAWLKPASSPILPGELIHISGNIFEVLGVSQGVICAMRRL